MKIVVSATDNSIEAPMDQRFGRAPWFVLVDSETGEWSAHANPAVESGHGAGIEASRAVAGLGAEAIVTGDVGPNAHRTLQAAGIPVYSARGATVRAAVTALGQGSLPQLMGPSTAGHSGGGAPAGGGGAGRGGGMGGGAGRGGGMGGGAGRGGGDRPGGGPGR
ncbi:MAG: NifB/NifX family molybdenum-iron cluster-binding protein [Thermoleophilia bacterium]|jgi:predicted Fe-Mo cluster-binding NifX family protein|nr:NifB/NifX family molybdenum-iron cluster-binding protein [Thermoleophilia bacterium]